MFRAAHYDKVSRRILRALRGKRSQAALARRLGFRSNVAAKWESGQRTPDAVSVFRHSRQLGIDIFGTCRKFHPPTADALSELEDEHLARWLDSLRGTQAVGSIAVRSGLSRFSVGRFLSGASKPNLPHLLALVDATTGRLADFVHAWVGLENVPELRAEYDRGEAARRALFEEPYCLAVMCLLDTQALKERSVDQIDLIAKTLERPRSLVKRSLSTLARAGIVREDDGHYAISGSLTIDARADPERERSVREYWARVSSARAAMPAETDLFSYNVFSVSRADYGKLAQLQREFYRGARALIAASEPTDVAGLLVVHLLEWDPLANAQATSSSKTPAGGSAASTSKPGRSTKPPRSR